MIKTTRTVWNEFGRALAIISVIPGPEENTPIFIKVPGHYITADQANELAAALWEAAYEAQEQTPEEDNAGESEESDDRE